jgi:hypothetical protein
MDSWILRSEDGAKLQVFSMVDELGLRLKGTQAVILTEDEVASLHVALGEWLEERR